MKIITHLHSTAKYNILKKQTKKDCPLGQSFSTLMLRLAIRDPDI